MNLQIAEIMGNVGVAKSIAEFLGVIESMDSKIDALIESEYKAGVSALEQAMASETEQASLLREARNRFNKSVHLEKKLRQALSYLGLATCHQLLGDESNADSALRKITGVTGGLFGSFLNDGAQLKLLQDNVYGYFDEKSPWVLEQELREAKKNFLEEKDLFQNSILADNKVVSSLNSSIIKQLARKVEFLCTTTPSNLEEVNALKGLKIEESIQFLDSANCRDRKPLLLAQIQNLNEECSEQLYSTLKEVGNFEHLLGNAFGTLETGLHSLTTPMKSDDVLRAQVLTGIQEQLFLELALSREKHASEGASLNVYKIRLEYRLRKLKLLFDNETSILSNFFLERANGSALGLTGKRHAFAEDFDREKMVLANLFEDYKKKSKTLKKDIEEFQRRVLF